MNKTKHRTFKCSFIRIKPLFRILIKPNKNCKTFSVHGGTKERFKFKIEIILKLKAKKIEKSI